MFIIFSREKEWNLKCSHALNEKWNENASRSRSQMKSEIEIPHDRDREVKFQKKSREFLRNKTLAGYCPGHLQSCRLKISIFLMLLPPTPKHTPPTHTCWPLCFLQLDFPNSSPSRRQFPLNCCNMCTHLSAATCSQSFEISSAASWSVLWFWYFPNCPFLPSASTSRCSWIVTAL